MLWPRRRLFALCLFFSMPAMAADSPENVLRAYVAMMQKDGVPAALARYTHPEECARYKALFMPRIREGFELGEDFSKNLLGEDFTLKQIETMPPAEFLSKVMRRTRLEGSHVKPPRVVGSRREGDVVSLDTITNYTDMQGVAAQKRDTVKFKAYGDTWRLMLSREMDAYAIVLISK